MRVEGVTRVSPGAEVRSENGRGKKLMEFG
jgi:hypothetical protein